MMPTAKPYLRLPCNGCCVPTDGLGNAKVNELELPLNQQEVGWLQVTVNNALLMYTGNSLHTQSHMHTGTSQNVQQATAIKHEQEGQSARSHPHMPYDNLWRSAEAVILPASPAAFAASRVV